MTPSTQLTILAIAKFPVVPEGTGPWNPANAVQPYFDPAIAAQLAANPSLAKKLAIYDTWEVDPSSGAVSLTQFAAFYSQIAVSNVPPVGYTSVSGNATVTNPNNVPLDLSQLQPGGAYPNYTIQPNPMGNFGGAPLLVSPAAVLPTPPAGTSTVDAELLADVRDIDTRLGGTPK